MGARKLPLGTGALVKSSGARKSFGLNRAAGHESEPWLRALQQDEPELFAALGAVVAHGYYMNEEVRRLIGYPGQERLPFDPDETPEYAANGMLGRVQARGPIWRDARKGENA